jgi:hypothetical protein
VIYLLPNLDTLEHRLLRVEKAAPVLGVPIHLALFNEPQHDWEGPDNLHKQEESLRRPGTGFIVTANPEDAEIIVFLESLHFKNRHNIPALLQEEFVRAFPKKCYVLNYRAEPVAFFPGVYTSLPRSRHDENWSRPGAYYLGNPNPHIAEYENHAWNPRHLFSFRGAMSHPVRRQLLQKAAAWGTENPVTWVDRWFNHNEAEFRDYLQEIVDSQFVLCPRGLAVSSHRVYETMRLGRVPVIIADDWLAPRGPKWEEFSITVAEDALDRIPSLLASVTDSAPGLGRKARAAWENWFSPDVVLRNHLNELVGLARHRRGLPSPDFAKHWRSRSFYRKHDWSVEQRIAQRLRGWMEQQAN